MRLVRFLLKTLGALLTVVILAIVVVNVYPHIRPTPKTVRAIGTISIPAPFKIELSFIDYLTVGGSRLYAGYATHGMVGVIDTATAHTSATVGGLGGVHGVALAPRSNAGKATLEPAAAVSLEKVSRTKQEERADRFHSRGRSQ